MPNLAYNAENLDHPQHSRQRGNQIHAGGLPPWREFNFFMKLNQTFISRLARLLFTPSVECNPAGVFTPVQKLL